MRNDAADAGGHARVADMGLSRRLEPGAAANLTGETGTYFYMAPEVFRHEVRRQVQSSVTTQYGGLRRVSQ